MFINEPLQIMERLKSKKSIALLFKEGSRIGGGHVVAIMRLLDHTENEWQVIRFGVSAPKKLLKKAVDRNRMKRLMREAFRLEGKALELTLRSQSKSMDILFIYQETKLETFFHIRQAIQKICRILHSKYLTYE